MDNNLAERVLQRASHRKTPVVRLRQRGPALRFTALMYSVVGTLST